MAIVEFRPITKDNYRDALKLKVNPDQENFVAPNTISLIQAHYHPEYHATPQGIYDGDTMVGFIMPVEPDPSDDEDIDSQKGEIWIMRYMIGTDHQGKGYGKAGMLKFIEWAKAQGKYHTVKLSYVPTNERAKAVYASVGFVEEGVKEEWGEMVAACKLTD
jgi:diamine N-acetyltransferase